MKLEDSTPYRSKFQTKQPFDVSSGCGGEDMAKKVRDLESSLAAANQLDRKQDALLEEVKGVKEIVIKCIHQSDMVPVTDMLESLSLRMAAQEDVFRQIQDKVEARAETGPRGNSNYSANPEKPAHFLLGSMNEKLVKSAASIDYITERLGKSLHRNQDMIRNQERLHQSLEQQREELSVLKRAFEHEKEQNSAKLNDILSLLTKMDRRSTSSLTTSTHPTLEKIAALKTRGSTETLCIDPSLPFP
jgi:DNA repair exonuclease SbcCD ATPase subunit